MATRLIRRGIAGIVCGAVALLAWCGPACADTGTAAADASAENPAPTAGKVAAVGSKVRPLANGWYSLVSAKKLSQSVSFNSAQVKTEGGAAELAAFAATSSQTFRVVYRPKTQAYTIKVKKSGRFLAAGSSKGAHVHQVDGNQKASAQWRIRKVGKGYRLVNKSSGYALAIAGGSAHDGARLVTDTKSSKAEALWSPFALSGLDSHTSSSVRLNRLVENFIAANTKSGDSAAHKLYKCWYKLTGFEYRTIHTRQPQSAGWSVSPAISMFVKMNRAVKNPGNCYSYASALGYVGRALGYPTRMRVGSVLLSSGLGEHAWVELKVTGKVRSRYPKASRKGQWRVFDPECAVSYGRSVKAYNVTKDISSYIYKRVVAKATD